jgi:gamma-glutamyltranspeptidase/glutathione hydrolase
VNVEARIPAEVRAALAARGHAIRELPEWSWVVGGARGLFVDPATGSLPRDADPRWDGYEVGW